MKMYIGLISLRFQISMQYGIFEFFSIQPWITRVVSILRNWLYILTINIYVLLTLANRSKQSSYIWNSHCKFEPIIISHIFNPRIKLTSIKNQTMQIRLKIFLKMKKKTTRYCPERVISVDPQQPQQRRAENAPRALLLSRLRRSSAAPELCTFACAPRDSAPSTRRKAADRETKRLARAGRGGGNRLRDLGRAGGD